MPVLATLTLGPKSPPWRPVPSQLCVPTWSKGIFFFKTYFCNALSKLSMQPPSSWTHTQLISEMLGFTQIYFPCLNVSQLLAINSKCRCNGDHKGVFGNIYHTWTFLHFYCKGMMRNFSLNICSLDKSGKTFVVYCRLFGVHWSWVFDRQVLPGVARVPNCHLDHHPPHRRP